MAGASYPHGKSEGRRASWMVGKAERRAERPRRARIEKARGTDLGVLGVQRVLELEVEGRTERADVQRGADVEHRVGLGLDVGLADRRVRTREAERSAGRHP